LYGIVQFEKAWSAGRQDIPCLGETIDRPVTMIEEAVELALLFVAFPTSALTGQFVVVGRGGSMNRCLAKRPEILVPPRLTFSHFEHICLKSLELTIVQTNFDFLFW
jgi:hypothetical protein